MRITGIKATRRGRISLYIDGEYACVLHPEVYATCAFGVDSEITEEQLEELRRISLEKLAKEKALGLLSQRSYPEKKLYEKVLAYTEDERVSAMAVARMKELGLVDDADYARRFTADCLNLKGYSLARTRQALREKGIERQVIEAALEDVEYDAQPAIAKLVRTKYRRKIGDEDGVRKTIAALQRRGFRYGDIRTVLQNLSEDEDYYEQE